MLFALPPDDSSHPAFLANSHVSQTYTPTRTYIHMYVYERLFALFFTHFAQRSLRHYIFSIIHTLTYVYPFVFFSYFPSCDCLFTQLVFKFVFRFRFSTFSLSPKYTFRTFECLRTSVALRLLLVGRKPPNWLTVIKARRRSCSIYNCADIRTYILKCVRAIEAFCTRRQHVTSFACKRNRERASLEHLTDKLIINYFFTFFLKHLTYIDPWIFVVVWAYGLQLDYILP